MEITSPPPDRGLPNLQGGQEPLWLIVAVSVALLFLWGILHLTRRFLLQSRKTGETATWGCGYSAPSPRMQYTASSFAQPLTDLFKTFLRTDRKEENPPGIFPEGTSFSTETPDLFP